MKSAKNNPWSKTEDSIVKAGILAGWANSTFEKALPDRSLKSIQNRAGRLGMYMSLVGKPNKDAKRMPAGTDGEILRLCAYIKSDSNIAEYMGVDTARVARIRRRIPSETPSPEPGLTDLDGPPISILPDPMAAYASNALRDRMIAAYQRQARRDRTDITTAMLSLLYGRSAAASFKSKGNAHV